MAMRLPSRSMTPSSVVALPSTAPRSNATSATGGVDSGNRVGRDVSWFGGGEAVLSDAQDGGCRHEEGECCSCEDDLVAGLGMAGGRGYADDPAPKRGGDHPPHSTGQVPEAQVATDRTDRWEGVHGQRPVHAEIAAISESEQPPQRPQWDAPAADEEQDRGAGHDQRGGEGQG